MKTFSTLAVALALTAGAATVIQPSEALAQKKSKSNAAAAGEPAARKFDISKEAQPSLQALEAAVQAKNHAGFAAALPAAQAAVKTADDRYFLAKFQLTHAIDTGDKAGQAAALEAVLASGSALPTEIPGIHRSLAMLADERGDLPAAATAYGRLLELTPNDGQMIANLAAVRIKQKNGAEALALLERAISANSAAGQPVPQAWYSNALKLAYDGKQNAKAITMSRTLLQAYPTPENWRNALVVYRNSVRADDATNLDILRLMRASGAMKERAEFLELAQMTYSSLPGEAKQVLDEGVRAAAFGTGDSLYRELNGAVASKVAGDRGALAEVDARSRTSGTGVMAARTAEAYLGYGDYAKAADLYRVALQKGGVDANVTNTRLGMALALSGRRPDAEAAFKAVSGPRADIAALWMAWMARPATS